MKYLRKYDNVNENVVIHKSSGFYNPMFLNGKKLVDIAVYDPKKGEVIFNIDRGWLEDDNGKNPNGFVLPEVLMKRKIDLTLKKPFAVNGRGNLNKSGLILYLPSDLVNFKYLGEIEKYSSKDAQSYYDQYEMTLDQVYTNATTTTPIPATFTYIKYKRSETTDYGAELKNIIKICDKEGNYEFKKNLEEIMELIKNKPEVCAFFNKLVSKARGSKFGL